MTFLASFVYLLRDFKFTWNYFKAACTYLWWLIQYKNLRLVTYSIYISMELFDCLFFTHTFFTYFSYGDLMYTWNYFQATYVYVPQVTYSVHLPPVIDLFYICGTFIAYFLHTPPLYWPIFCNYHMFMTSLYTSDVNSLFWLFTSHWWAYHYVIDIISLRTLTSGDLFCTNT